MPRKLDQNRGHSDRLKSCIDDAENNHPDGKALISFVETGAN